MAMKIGGHYEFERIYLRHWQRLSRTVGLAFPLIRTTITRLEKKLQEAILVELRSTNAEEAHKILGYLSNHAQTMASQARTGPADLATEA